MNFVFSLVPMALTTVMIATAMPAAIRPYSMTVAPDPSSMKASLLALKWISTAHTLL